MIMSWELIHTLRYSTSLTTWTLITSIVDTTKAITGLTSNTIYYIQVRAVAASTGEYSQPGVFKTNGCANTPGATTVGGICAVVGPPDSPTNVQLVGSVTPTSASFQWDEPVTHGEQITSYSLEISDTGGSTWNTMVVFTRNSSVGNLIPKTAYLVQVRANSASGASPPSLPLALVTVGPPDTPVIQSISVSYSSVNVSWSIEDLGAEDQMTETLLVTSVDGFISTYSQAIITSSHEHDYFHTLAPFNSNQLYQLKLQASNIWGSSPWSYLYSFTTLYQRTIPIDSQPKLCTVFW